MVIKDVEFGYGGLWGEQCPCLMKGRVSWLFPRSRGCSFDGCHWPSGSLLNTLLTQCEESPRVRIGGEQGQQRLVKEETFPVSTRPCLVESTVVKLKTNYKQNCPWDIAN